MKGSTRILFCAAMVLAAGVVWHAVSQAQPAKPSDQLQPPAARAKFAFDVVESFDAKYLGDTPGHTGRNGGLEGIRPNIALGDPVYRGDIQVGKITGLVWERIRGSLTVEFDPIPLARITVGDTLWINLDTSSLKKADE